MQEKIDILMFIMESCPYCREALKWMEELIAADNIYSVFDIKIVDENKERKLADSYDYYYVPTYYIGWQKVHEGAATKEKIRDVFDTALSRRA